MESNNVSWTRTFQFCPVPIRSATAKRRPCAPKSVSPADCRYNRDVYKTVDDISANKVDYHSFCYEFLLCGSFVFMQLSLSWEKHFKNLWCHHIVKSSGWARTRGQDQQNKLHRAYSAGYVTWKLENFPGVRTRRASLIEMNGRQLRVHCADVFQIYGRTCWRIAKKMHILIKILRGV